ncbi:MAG: hypothetical protein ACTSU5_02860 [Promethearchaeota archaeon]
MPFEPECIARKMDTVGRAVNEQSLKKYGGTVLEDVDGAFIQVIESPEAAAASLEVVKRGALEVASTPGGIELAARGAYDLLPLPRDVGDVPGGLFLKNEPINEVAWECVPLLGGMVGALEPLSHLIEHYWDEGEGAFVFHFRDMDAFAVYCYIFFRSWD